MNSTAPKVFPNLPPQIAMLQMIGGFRVSRAIYAVAELGIADLLSEMPRTASELAQATDSQASSLYRVLRALAGVGVFAEDEDGRFHLAPPGEFLRSHAPDSIDATIRLLGEPWHWQVWEHLLDSVETGNSAFEQLNGQDFFDFSICHPEFAQRTGSSKTSISARAASSLVKNYDFSTIDTVVEVALCGGHGNTMIALLNAYPQLSGVLSDVPSVVAGAASAIEAAGLSDRCKVVEGHCLESIPPNGDAYVLMFVLHNWDDRRAVQILANCRNAMNPGGKLVIVEMLMPAGNDPFVGKYVDLESLLITPGGYERTEAQYRSLLDAAGFCTTRVIATHTANSIIEAEAQ